VVETLQRWTLWTIVLATFALGSIAFGATMPAAAASATCSASPTTVHVGETVTLDASDSQADYVEFDQYGTGNYDQTDETDFIISVEYYETGTYEPAVRADGEGGDTAQCGTVRVVENEPPTAEFSFEPDPAVAGQPVEFDASESTDSDGSISEYQWSFDGSDGYEVTTSEPTVNHTFYSTGYKNVRLRVVDDDGSSDQQGRDVQVVEPTPTAACSVSPTTVTVGESVTIDARDSQNGSYIDYDLDGDGEYDRFERTNFTTTTSYEEPGTYAPTVKVYSGYGESDTEECPTVTVEPENTPPTANFSFQPDPAFAGQSTTFDATASSDPDGDIVEYRWDWDGDEAFEDTTTEPTIEQTFGEPGSYVVGLVVVDDDGARDRWERTVEVDQPTVVARCSAEPETIEPGGTVTIDASESENGSFIVYDFDGDGEYDSDGSQSFTTQQSFDETGTYAPTVRVYRSSDAYDVAECPSITVEESNEPPAAAFDYAPSPPKAGEEITFDASDSSDPDGTIVRYRWDFDGDGEYDRNTTNATVTHSYSDLDEFAPKLDVVDDGGARDDAAEELTVETPSSDDGPPWEWIIPGAGGVIGVGGLLYHFYGSGGGTGGGGGGGSQDSKPKPKPRLGGLETGGRYETGVFEIPDSSGTLTVSVGFDPDLLLFEATNGARTDTATDRTAGWSHGLAHDSADGLRNQCLSVADDAHTTDQSTCASADDLALQLVRHEPDAPPGRVTVRVTETTKNGFEADVSVPGDDPLAGGIRVLYKAFRTGSDSAVETGTLMTPTEPGTQTIELGIDADHVALSSSAAVEDTDQLWTTDQGVGLSTGYAVEDADSTQSQTVAGSSSWPGVGHPSAAVCDDASVLTLLYQDGDRLAGRTRASVTSLGDTIRLQYDRVYNGPHKLGSTARHPVSYLAMNGGESMRPTIGTFSLPNPGEHATIDCAFEPELIEFQIRGPAVGEEVSTGADAHPFGWSHGTAIRDGDTLRQYLLHHAARPANLRASADGAAAAGSQATTESARSGAATDGGVAARSRDSQRASDASDGDDGESAADGRAGLWLATSPDGTVVGRDLLSVEQITETGFQVGVESVSTDGRGHTGTRPTVIYRAWPTLDSDGTVSRQASSPAEEATESGEARTADSQPTSHSTTHHPQTSNGSSANRSAQPGTASETDVETAQPSREGSK